MVRPRPPRRSTGARSFCQLRGFRGVINTDKVFGTHNGRPSRPRELEPVNCIQLRRSTGSIFDWDFVEDGKPVKVAIDGSLIVNDVEVCLRAVLRGVGFARLPISLVMSYIEKGEMETALDEYAVEVPGLMLYYPSRSQSLPKLRAFAAFAQTRMPRDFRPADYLPTVLP